MRETGKVWGAVAGTVVLLAGLSGAQAQDAPPGCVASNPGGAAAGALLGGVAGALLGNAVSGRHKAGGTIIGGVTGMAAGAAIGGNAGVAPCPQGYAYRAVAPPIDERPLPVAREGDVWYGAPPSIHERIVFLRRRVEKLDDAGWLSPRESEGVRHEIAAISNREEHVRDLNDGHLPPEVREQLFDDLNVVSRRLRWKEYRVQHAEE